MNDAPHEPSVSNEPQAPPPRKPEAASPLDAIIPTNPLAAVACYMGIVSIICCPGGPLLGPAAILLGVLGLKKWKVQESSYGKTTSTVRAWIGIVTGIIGTIVGVIVVFLLIMDQLQPR